jgi:aerobic carbon-monoxide dehydrogenase medium subunit
VKPAPFEYVHVEQVADALDALRTDDDAKVLAGGQSLVPLMALRLARPTLLVDVNDLPLDVVEFAGTGVRLGGLVRHSRLEHDPTVSSRAPLLAAAARLIGHPAIRARGTLGGSIAHADPAAEIPAALVALDAVVEVQGASGARAIAAAGFFDGFFTTALAPDELVVGIDVAVPDRCHGAAFHEWAPRAGDFATAGVAVALELDDGGTCARARAAACGVASTPVDLRDALRDAGVPGAAEPTGPLLRSVAGAVARAIADDDRAQLAGLLAASAVREAFTNARRAEPGRDGVAA